jgi:hypothetical protein
MVMTVEEVKKLVDQYPDIGAMILTQQRLQCFGKFAT